MNVADYNKYFPDRLRPEVVYAGEFLEFLGYRFGIEFGSTNAIEKATTELLKQKDGEWVHL